MSVKFTVGDLHREIPPTTQDLRPVSKNDTVEPPTVADVRPPQTTPPSRSVAEEPSVFESQVSAPTQGGTTQGGSNQQRMEPISIPDGNQSIVPTKTKVPVHTSTFKDTRRVTLLGICVIVMLGLTWYTGQHSRSTTLAQCGSASEYLKWVVGLMFAFLVALLGYFIWWCRKVLRQHHSQSSSPS